MPQDLALTIRCRKDVECSHFGLQAPGQMGHGLNRQNQPSDWSNWPGVRGVAAAGVAVSQAVEFSRQYTYVAVASPR